MTLSDEDLAALREILSDAEGCGRLSDWQRQFCDGLRERVAEYGAETFVSHRQWEALRRIEGVIYG